MSRNLLHSTDALVNLTLGKFAVKTRFAELVPSLLAERDVLSRELQRDSTRNTLRKLERKLLVSFVKEKLVEHIENVLDMY